MQKNQTPGNGKIHYLVQLAVLVAIMLLLHVSGLGYLSFGAIEMTIMPVPVMIGAILLGPLAGAILGLAFGLTSLWQAFAGSPFGMALLSISVWETAVLCLVPRVLMGFLCALVFRALQKRMQNKTVPFVVAGVSAALLNTALFMTFLMVLFGGTEYLNGLRAGAGFFRFVVVFVGLNGLIEAIACAILGATCARTTYGLLHKK